MRRLEYSDEKSNKFWQVVVQGADVTTEWGRIGSSGQCKTKTFGSDDAAAKAAEKQLQTKLKKGYAEVGGVAAPPPAPTKPAPTPASVAQTLPAPSPPEEAVATERVTVNPALVPLPAFEPSVDLKGLTRWTLRGEKFNKPKPQPQDGPTHSTPRLAAQAIKAFYAASQRVQISNGAHVDSLCRKHSPVFMFEVGLAVDEFLTNTQNAFLVCCRIGDWLSGVDDATWNDLRARAEAKVATARSTKIACMAAMFRDKDWAAHACNDPALHSIPELVAMHVDPAQAAALLRGHKLGWGWEHVGVVLLQMQGANALEALRHATDTADDDNVEEWAKMLRRVVSVDAARYFGTVAGPKPVLREARKFLGQYPELVLRIWAQEEPPAGSLADVSFKAAVGRHPDLALRAAIDGRLAAVQEILEGPADAAPKSAWPPVLQDPPWRRAKLPPSTLPTLIHNIALPTLPSQLDWAPAERERFAGGDQRLTAGTTSATLMSIARYAETGEALAMWKRNSIGSDGWFEPRDLLKLLAKVGNDGIDTLLSRGSDPAYLPGLMRLTDTRVARALLPHFDKKKYRGDVVVWLSKHPQHALYGLLPVAFGEEPQAVRATAQSAIRVLFEVKPIATAAAAESLANQVQGALAELLAVDPLLRLPKKRKKVSEWLDPGSLTTLTLKSGGTLPFQATEALLEMLAFTTLEDPYVGLDQVREYVTSESLVLFARSLLDTWLLASGQGKDNYCLMAAGHFGDDSLAHYLTPMIRRWPGEAAHARAVLGLDVLRAIGTDVALMHLYAMSQKLKFKGLKNKANEKVQQIADSRGLTGPELADRLVPDLGLDADGTRWLDFGPRKFRVGFDEALKPWVADESGKHRKALPKPGQKDDADKANEATNIWKALKKDARATATTQLLRLERCMVDQRRWSAADWKTFFVDHPLMIHLTRRLVWGTYEDGAIQQTFRVAEDGSFANVNDDVMTLDPSATVGMPHRLELNDAQGWGEMLGDYEILQPFDQLSRPVYHRTPEEVERTKLDRVLGKIVPWGRVKGLEKRGWRHGEPQDAGWIWEYIKVLPDGREVYLELKTGLSVASIEYNEDQVLGDLSIDASMWARGSGARWGSISEVAFSELVLDLMLMVQD
jgi:predicted DNA-binding WGR domain protein